jgi:hypothetical protein
MLSAFLPPQPWKPHVLGSHGGAIWPCRVSPLSPRSFDSWINGSPWHQLATSGLFASVSDPVPESQHLHDGLEILWIGSAPCSSVGPVIDGHRTPTPARRSKETRRKDFPKGFQLPGTMSTLGRQATLPRRRSLGQKTPCRSAQNRGHGWEVRVLTVVVSFWFRRASGPESLASTGWSCPALLSISKRAEIVARRSVADCSQCSDTMPSIKIYRYISEGV